MVLVAVFRDRYPLDQFHHEVGMAGIGGAGIEYAGDVGVIHQGQRCRSDSKRAMTCDVSMPGLMIFRATWRRTGFSCSAI